MVKCCSHICKADETRLVPKDSSPWASFSEMPRWLAPTSEKHRLGHGTKRQTTWISARRYHGTGWAPRGTCCNLQEVWSGMLDQCHSKCFDKSGCPTDRELKSTCQRILENMKASVKQCEPASFLEFLGQQLSFSTPPSRSLVTRRCQATRLKQAWEGVQDTNLSGVRLAGTTWERWCFRVESLAEDEPDRAASCSN